MALLLACCGMGCSLAVERVSKPPDWYEKPGPEVEPTQEWRDVPICNGDIAHRIEEFHREVLSTYLNVCTVPDRVWELALRWFGEHGYLDCSMDVCVYAGSREEGIVAVMLIYPELATRHQRDLVIGGLDFAPDGVEVIPSTVEVYFQWVGENWDWAGAAPWGEVGRPCKLPPFAVR